VTTHVNPDGDGLGSEAGLVHLLRARGINAVVTNPSPTPERYGFLFRELPGVDRTTEAVKELRRADLILVLDIADVGRLGMLTQTVLERGVPVACVDHHVSQGHLPDGARYVDPEASATGELIYQLAVANEWPLTPLAARALYVAILTDTGGFRFSNTRPAVLRAAADLLETGLDPEQIYLDVYANAPEGRARLLAETLQTLVVEPDHGLAWVTVPPGSLERLGATPDDLDGIVEVARSIIGVRMALLFREIAAESEPSLRGRGRCGRLLQAVRGRRTHQGLRTLDGGFTGPRAGRGAERRPRVPFQQRQRHMTDFTAGSDILDRIERTLDTLRPYIASHRGNVEVVDFDEGEGVLLVRLGGTCHGCSASTITLKQGIESRLRQLVPEVKQVEAI
jgi:phosphoesterase RecJ-like protein